MKEHQILQTVYEIAKENPLLCVKMTEKINEGLNKAYEELRTQCGDMEVALYISLHRKTFKKYDEEAIEKLKPYLGKTFLCWDSYLSREK